MAKTLITAFADQPPDVVVHSGLRRTRLLAAKVAAAYGADMRADPRWAERDFGDWEGRSWTAIWRETGDAMDGMLTDPAGYRPGGGETTAELAARAWAGWTALPENATVLVVTHGGPIATVRMRLEGFSYADLPALIPPPGGRWPS